MCLMLREMFLDDLKSEEARTPPRCMFLQALTAGPCMHKGAERIVEFHQEQGCRWQILSRHAGS